MSTDYEVHDGLTVAERSSKFTFVTYTHNPTATAEELIEAAARLLNIASYNMDVGDYEDAVLKSFGANVLPPWTAKVS